MCASTQFPVIVKNSSPKNLSANCWPTDDQLSADSWPTVGWQVFWGAFLRNYRFQQATDRLPTRYQQSADCRQTGSQYFGQNLLAVCRPTVGRQTTNCRPTVGLQVFWGALPHNYPISCNMKFPDYWKPSKLVFLKSHPGHIVKCFTISTFAVHHFTVSLQYFEFCLVESEKMFF